MPIGNNMQLLRFSYRLNTNIYFDKEGKYYRLIGKDYVLLTDIELKEDNLYNYNNEDW